MWLPECVGWPRYCQKFWQQPLFLYFRTTTVLRWCYLIVLLWLHLQKEVRNSFEKTCIVAKNVAAFFRARVTGAHSQSQKDQLLVYKQWVTALQQQVCECLPLASYRPDDPQLIKAIDLLKLIITFKDSAWAAYQHDMEAHGKAGPDSLRQLHDALIMCCPFGWVPPMRITMLVSLQKPGMQKGCLVEGCNCPGNFLEWKGGSLVAVVGTITRLSGSPMLPYLMRSRQTWQKCFGSCCCQPIKHTWSTVQLPSTQSSPPKLAL